MSTKGLYVNSHITRYSKPLSNLATCYKANLNVFIKFHLASHFALYLKNELKFKKKKITVLLI